MARLKQEINSDLKKINTKIGIISLNPEDIIYFPHSILGFPKSSRYCFLELNNESCKGFKLLQSVDEEHTCFIVIPLSNKFFENNDSLIKKTDIELASSSYNIVFDNLNVYLITSIQKDPLTLESNLTVNLRAPILIDTTTKIAYQHVFVRSKYSIAHILK